MEGNPSSLMFNHPLSEMNDNDPEFEQSEYRVRLMENSAKETLKDTVKCH